MDTFDVDAKIREAVKGIELEAKKHSEGVMMTEYRRDQWTKLADIIAYHLKQRFGSGWSDKMYHELAVRYIKERNRKESWSSWMVRAYGE